MREKSIDFQKLIPSIVQREEEEEEKKYSHAYMHIYIYMRTLNAIHTGREKRSHYVHSFPKERKFN